MRKKNKGNKEKNCLWCNKKFWSWTHQKQIFCSNQCSALGRTASSRYVKKCKHCGNEFTTRKNRNQFFCSRECYLALKSKSTKYLTCVVCKKSFKVKLIEQKRNRKFCSNKCMGVSYSKMRQGKNNPQYKDGKSKQRAIARDCDRTTIEYKDWRRDVFQRDNYTCQECGRKRVKGDRVVLHAHHKKSWIDSPRLRFNAKNGVTLCKECHSKAHKKKVK